MKITPLNLTNFKSNYKFNITSKDFSNGIKAQGKLEMLSLKDDDGCKIFSEYNSYPQQLQTGVIEKITISAKDKYDKFIESVLKQHNINFKKQSQKEALEIENIYNRIVLPQDYPNDTLIGLDTKKIEELFKKDKGFYISKNGESGAISTRYNDVKKYLASGADINASKIYLSERENGELVLNFQDGRHRFAVMRDMGMEKIKFSLDKESLKLAYKHGLIRE